MPLAWHGDSGIVLLVLGRCAALTTGSSWCLALPSEPVTASQPQRLLVDRHSAVMGRYPMIPCQQDWYWYKTSSV